MSKKEQITDAQMLRMKAEKKLAENKKALDESGLESDVKKLLHELQVHQIELEMQNEELSRANETAEAALKKYTMLYDFAPMGYFTLGDDGTILELNFTGAEMLGDKRVGLIGANFKLFVADESKTVFSNFISKIFNSNTKESCQIVLGYKNENSTRIYIEGIVLTGDTNCLLSVVDISAFTKHKIVK